MAVNPATVREKNVRITTTPKDKGVQVVITIRRMDKVASSTAATKASASHHAT